ncbi:MAG: hypothetical protein GYA66_15075, partial [Phyllobacteriaceae bacterium]|nr:hypothetical protein [Phyllobacteriaceae bacterium]
MSVHTPQRELEAEAKRIAESLIPELKSRAKMAEDMRQVPKESVELLRKSGLLTTVQPATCGGQQMSFRGHVNVMSAIARGCASTAWVLGVWQAHSWMFGHMDAQAQQDVFGENGELGNQPVAAVIGPRGKAIRHKDGSYTVSGFWPFASGNAHSTWLLLGCEIFNEVGEKLDDGDVLV